eukprot:scaffold30055_cov65-Phaeocystis_antarctica.AAC.5
MLEVSRISSIQGFAKHKAAKHKAAHRAAKHKAAKHKAAKAGLIVSQVLEPRLCSASAIMK